MNKLIERQSCHHKYGEITNITTSVNIWTLSFRKREPLTPEPTSRLILTSNYLKLITHTTNNYKISLLKYKKSKKKYKNSCYRTRLYGWKYKIKVIKVVWYLCQKGIELCLTIFHVKLQIILSKCANNFLPITVKSVILNYKKL